MVRRVAEQEGMAVPNVDMPEPVVLFEGESELNGLIQIHEVSWRRVCTERAGAAMLEAAKRGTN